MSMLRNLLKPAKKGIVFNSLRMENPSVKWMTVSGKNRYILISQNYFINMIPKLNKYINHSLRRRMNILSNDLTIMLSETQDYINRLGREELVQISLNLHRTWRRKQTEFLSWFWPFRKTSLKNMFLLPLPDFWHSEETGYVKI